MSLSYRIAPATMDSLIRWVPQLPNNFNPLSLRTHFAEITQMMRSQTSTRFIFLYQELGSRTSRDIPKHVLSLPRNGL